MIIFLGLNFEPEKIKPQLELYLGALPSNNRVENWKDVGVTHPSSGSGPFSLLRRSARLRPVALFLSLLTILQFHCMNINIHMGMYVTFPTKTEVLCYMI